MKLKFKVITLFLVCCTAISCSTKQPKITDYKWQLVEIISQDSLYSLTAPCEGVVINFSSEGSVVGFGGCNNFFGEYSLEGKEKIKINLSATTMSMCEYQNFEDIYLSLLANSTTYTILQNQLQLNDTRTQSTLLFKIK